MKNALITNASGEEGYGELRYFPVQRAFAKSSAKQTKQSDKQSVSPVKTPEKGQFPNFFVTAPLEADLTRQDGKLLHLIQHIGVAVEGVERVILDDSFDAYFAVMGVKRKDWTKPQETK